MQTVVVVIHLMVVLAMIGVVLLQRSEGGGLGVGGGGGFMSSRGTANVLTRATAILAGVFFVTSLTLSILASLGHRPTSIIGREAPGGTSARSSMKMAFESTALRPILGMRCTSMCRRSRSV